MKRIIPHIVHLISLQLILLLVLILSFPENLFAKPIIADLALNNVSIDHNFRGLDVLMFMVKNDPGKIVVVLRGNDKNYVVRKKKKVMGLWVNSKSVEFNGVPGLYLISSTDSLSSVKNDTLLKSLGIGLKNMNIKTIYENPEVDEFRKALIEYKQKENMYSYDISKISLRQENIFRTYLKFPKNIEAGVYIAEIYLFNDGQLNSIQSTPVTVNKVGFEAFMSELAHELPFIYGIICVAMALGAGWLANAVFSRV